MMSKVRNKLHKIPAPAIAGAIRLFAGCRAERKVQGDRSVQRARDQDLAFRANGRLHLQGTFICNEKGSSSQLMGMSTHGLQHRGNRYNVVALDTLISHWGANIVRLSMYAQEGGYEKDPDYWDGFVDALIGKLYAKGVYCLADRHMLHPGDPNANLDLATSFFLIGDTLPFNNIHCTVHFYAGDPDDCRRMTSAKNALQAGIAILATEWGTQNGWGDGPNDFAKSLKWLDFMRLHKTSWCNWNHSSSPLSGAVWKEGTAR